MKAFKKISSWVLTGLFIILALASIPSLSSVMACIIFLVLLPVDKWQNILRKFLNIKIKITVIVVLTIIMLVLFQKADTNTGKESTFVITPITITETAEPASIPATKSVEHTATTETHSSSVPVLTTEPTPTEKTTSTPVTEPAHTHKFTNATCTKPETCDCGETKGSAIGHNWKSATCTYPKTCTVCGETSGSKTSHSYSEGICTFCYASDPDYVAEIMVWIPTNGGTKYHSRSSCSNMSNPEKVTLSEAQSRGFTSCKRCH